jgi:hypothetical protein
MSIALDAVIGIIVAYFAFVFVRDFVSTSGSIWTRLLAAGKDSAVILVHRFVIICSGISYGMVWVANALNAPGVADKIQTVLQPQYVAAFLIGLALLTELARRRTLAT